MRKNKNWQCPYCGHRQVLVENQDFEIFECNNIVSISEHGLISFHIISISCLNTQCKKLTLKGDLMKKEWNSYQNKYIYEEIKTWSLLPDSIAKPQPDYIPTPIKKDYEEACKIVNLSPNASAVLSRRCLESMIKDFCKIKEDTLYQSIELLSRKLENNQAPKGVTEETIEAIGSIREMGNIGAHMKIQTNILVDIEPKEAILLIQLIETLFEDWYVARDERQQRLNKIKKSIIQKKQKQNSEEKTKNAKAHH